MVARGAADKSVYPVNLPSPDRYVYMSGELVPETEATLSIYDTAVTTTTHTPRTQTCHHHTRPPAAAASSLGVPSAWPHPAPASLPTT